MTERVHEPTLVCPRCTLRFPVDERFCPDCRLPLVLEATGEEPDFESDRHQRIRKVKPQLSEGELVKVAWARNESEGQFIQGLLLEEGVPSMLRRSAGFDVPDFLAAGPRDVMVPISGAQTAREVLLQSDVIGAGIYLRQKLAFADCLPLFESDVHQISTDLRGHRDVLQRRYGTERANGQPNVAAAHLCHPNGLITAILESAATNWRSADEGDGLMDYDGDQRKHHQGDDPHARTAPYRVRWSNI